MERKRQICKIGIGGILSVGVIILLMLWFGNVYLNQEKKLHAELRELFTGAMQDEKEQHKDFQNQKRNYDPQRSPNDISGEEKHARYDQIYLTMHDPNRHLLDSLFKVILQKKNIEAKTAIRYIGNGEVINTSTDNLFYKNATLLNPIVYRIDENEEKNITLQAYVDVPIRMVLRRIGWFWVISFVILIILAGGCGIYFNKLKEYIEKIIKSLKESEALVVQQKIELNELQAKKRETERINKQQLEMIEKKQAELLVSQNKIKSLFPKQKIDWIILPCGVLFDEKHGVIRLENGKPVSLKNTPLKLFCCFIKAEDYKLMSKDICTDVLKRPVENVLSDSDRETVSTTVGRLRKFLKPFPCIKIESDRKVGYQMTFSNYQNDTTLPGKSD